MALTGITFNDIVKEVYLRCKGQQFALTKWGSARILDAINNSLRTIMTQVGTLSFAGELYVTLDHTATATDLQAPAWSTAQPLKLVSCEIYAGTLGAANQGTSIQISPQKILQVNQAALYTGHNVWYYAFTGDDVIVRPTLTTATPACHVNIHYIKMPTAFTGTGTEYLVTSPMLFRPIAADAAAALWSQLESATAEDIGFAFSQRDKELERILDVVKQEQLADHAMRTGGAVSSGQVPPGALLQG